MYLNMIKTSKTVWYGERSKCPNLFWRKEIRFLFQIITCMITDINMELILMRENVEMFLMNIMYVLNIIKFEEIHISVIWDIFNFLLAKRNFNTQKAIYLFIFLPIMTHNTFKGFSSDVRKCNLIKYYSAVLFSLSCIKYRRWYTTFPFRIAIYNIKFHKKYFRETNCNILYIFTTRYISWR